MTQPTLRARGRLPAPRSQRGTMLIIALIVLVAMTLAGIATMRSVDTATVMAGNIAFRKSTLVAADQGIQAAFALLSSTVNSTTLDLNKDAMGGGTAAAAGYYSSASPVEPNWSDPAAWNNATQLPPDSAGNVVWFIIERMCRIANCKPGDTCGGASNVCGSTPSTGAVWGREGEDNFRPADSFNAPAPHYRITARAVGPRNSIAIVQTMTR